PDMMGMPGFDMMEGMPPPEFMDDMIFGMLPPEFMDGDFYIPPEFMDGDFYIPPEFIDGDFFMPPPEDDYYDDYIPPPGEDVFEPVTVTEGTAGNDILYGTAANDAIVASGGNDTIDGLGGIDTMTYTNIAADPMVDLVGGQAINVTLNGATAATVTVGGTAKDTIKNIENFIGAGGDDTITGDSGANTLEGLAGADTLNGGDGIDTVSYQNSTEGVTVDLSDSLNNANGDAEGDTLTNFENILGSNFDDDLTGDEAANNIMGGDGDDTIYGGAGVDTIYGGAGINEIEGGDGDDIIYLDTVDTEGYDTIIVDGGSDTIYGFGGIETDIGVSEDIDSIYVSNGASAIVTVTSDFTANDSTYHNGTGGGTVTLNLANGIDTDLSLADTTNDLDGYIITAAGNTMASTIVGSEADDTITGGIGNDTLTGEDGIDILIGGDGDDTLFIDDDDTTISGGAGIDTVSLDNNIDVSAATFNTIEVITATEEGADLTVSVVQANALNAVAASFTGDGTINDEQLIINGTGGTDIINLSSMTFTNSGATINGDMGADVITGSNGNDTITTLDIAIVDGGDGTGDTVQYFAAVSAANLSDSDLVNVENIEITQVMGDMSYDFSNQTEDLSITGNTSGDTITGGAGDDTITGGASDDTLDGGTGNDTFVFSTAAGNGTDAISNFTVGTGNDMLNIINLSTVGTGNIGTAVSSATVALSDFKVITILDNANFADENDVMSKINFAIDTTGDVTGNTLIAIDNGTDNTAIFSYSDDGNAAGIQVAELTKIANLSGVDDVSTLHVDNFVFA
ncbi:MAG: hypothetical protein KAQ94_09725, partial [Arcobacteraceae bacterium]|nr:hypothetical protein [Arcobacteraceae bacterium]